MRAAISIALLPLVACTPVPPESTPLTGDSYGSGNCDPRPASSLVGQKATSETGAQALKLTGAKSLRWGPPGAVFTMDFSPMRVNVMYDDAMTITEVRCG